MNLKNLIVQWDNNSQRLAGGFQLEKTQKKIKERIKKELLNENENAA